MLMNPKRVRFVLGVFAVCAVAAVSWWYRGKPSTPNSALTPALPPGERERQRVSAQEPGADSTARPHPASPPQESGSALLHSASAPERIAAGSGARSPKDLSAAASQLLDIKSPYEKRSAAIKRLSSNLKQPDLQPLSSLLPTPLPRD